MTDVVDELWEEVELLLESELQEVGRMQLSKQDSGTWVPYLGPDGGEGWQNTDTGEVVYQDEPPGADILEEDIEDMAEEFLLEEVDEEELREQLADDLTVDPDRFDHEQLAAVAPNKYSLNELTEMLDEAGKLEEADAREYEVFDPYETEEREPLDKPTGPADIPEPNADFSDVDWGDITDDEKPRTLSTEQKDTIRDALEEEYGEEPVEKMYDRVEDWKWSSYSEPAWEFVKSFEDVAELEEEHIRNDEIKGEPPSETEKQIAHDLHVATLEWFESTFGENGEMHRGFPDLSRIQMFEEVFEELNADSMRMEGNSTDNWSGNRDTAGGFADDTDREGFAGFAVKREVNVNEVVVSTNGVMTDNREMEEEVLVKSDEYEVDYEDIKLYLKHRHPDYDFNDRHELTWSPGVPLEEHDAATLHAFMKYMDRDSPMLDDKAYYGMYEYIQDIPELIRESDREEAERWAEEAEETIENIAQYVEEVYV